MWHVLFTIAILPSTTSFSDAKTTNASIYNMVHQFIVDNGHHNVDMFFNSSTHAWRRFTSSEVYFARNNVLKAKTTHNGSFSIFIFDSERDDLVFYLKCVCQRRIRMSLLLLTNVDESDEVSVMRRFLGEFQETSYFYVAKPTSYNSLSWHRLISLKSGTILDELTFASGSFRIVEEFDMKGLRIRSTSLTWVPYLTIEDCNKFGRECETNYGYLIDCMDRLALKYNFTYTSEKNLGHWGVASNGQSLSEDGIGIMNDVANGKYDMSLSSWIWNLETDGLAQFVPAIRKRLVLVMRHRGSSADFRFFLRAFSPHSWASVLLMAGAAVSCISLMDFLSVKEGSHGPKMIASSFYLFFLLINAYYCGVLVMFLATNEPQLFKTEKDVLQAYPTWRLKYLHYLIKDIFHMVEEGDPVYVDTWQRYNESPSEWTYHSVDEAIEFVLGGQNVAKIGEDRLLAHLKSNPIEQHLHLFDHNKWQFRYILFHKNSPLLPMFKQGANHFVENGVLDELHQKWFGKKILVSIPDTGEDEGAFGLGQMILVLVIVPALYLLALIIFCVEAVFLKWGRREHIRINAHDR